MYIYRIIDGIKHRFELTSSELISAYCEAEQAWCKEDLENYLSENNINLNSQEFSEALNRYIKSREEALDWRMILESAVRSVI